MKKAFLKKFGVLALMSIVTAGISGTSVYFAMGAISPKNDNDDGGGYDTPDIDDNGNQKEENGFSKTINSLLNAKQLKNGNISLDLSLSENDPITLSLSNLNVDLSNLNTTTISLSTDMKVKYRQIEQSLSLRVEENEYCYVNFKKAKMMLDAPESLYDVFQMLKRIGILVPSADESTSSIDLDSILSSLTDMVDDIKVSDEAVMDNNVSFDITIPDIEINDIKITGLKLNMVADKDTYSLKQVSSLNDIQIMKKEADGTYTSILGVGLSGDMSLESISDYQGLSVSDALSQGYSSIKEPGNDVLTTIADIIGGTSDVKINVAMDTAETGKDDTSILSRHDFDIDGRLQMKIDNADFKNGTYALALDHLNKDEDSSTVLNDLYVLHQNKKTYLKFNELLKAKVSDTTVGDVFKLITEGSGQKMIETVSSKMNTTLGSLDINKIKDGDFSQIQGLLSSQDTYFSYDEATGSFILGLDGAYLGLTKGPIKLIVNCSKDATSSSKNGIKNIAIEGLTFEDTKDDVTTTRSLSVRLDVEDASPISTLDDEEYSDFKGVVPIFDSICNIIGNKMFNASYDIYFNDKVNTEDAYYNAISASGNISADLSKENESGKLLDAFRNGDYHLSMNATTLKGDYNHNLDLHYQDRNLYFGYDSLSKSDSEKDVTVFKNYIREAQIGEMKSILDTKTKSNVSVTFDDVSKVLDALSASEKFKEAISCLKKGSLKGFDDFISIKAEDVQDKNVISLEIKASELFKDDSFLGKSIGNITLLLDSNALEDGSLKFEGIQIDTCITKDQDFTFKMKFLDDPVTRLSADELGKYQEITEFSTFGKAFYNLGNDLTKYGIKVNAEYHKNPLQDQESGYQDNVTIDGSCYWDMENKDLPKIGGGLRISHPYISIGSDFSTAKTQADQNLSFRYQNVTEDDAKDGEFTLDYNSNMHVLLHSSTIGDVVDTISRTSSTSLLNKLLTTSSNIASDMPIKDAISLKAPSLLLDYPYVNSVSFESGKIVLKVDKRLFNIHDEGEFITLSISYEGGEKPVITSLECNLSAKDDSTICKATISLTNYDESALPSVMEYNEANKDKFVNLDGMKNLVKMALDTSEFNYFHFGGYLDLDILLGKDVPVKIDQYSFDLNLSSDIYIKDEGVYAYISLALGDKQLEDAGYYVTEYAFKDGKVYIDNTRTDSYYNEEGVIKNKVTSKAMRVTKGEFEKNVLYYIGSLGLDMDDRIAGKTIMANVFHALDNKEETSSTDTGSSSKAGNTSGLDITLSSDFSSLIQAGTLYNENKQKFTLGLDLDSLLSVTYGEDKTPLLSFKDTYLKLYHQTKTLEDGSKKTPFFGLQLSSDISLLSGLADISLKGQILSYANNGELNYYQNEEDSGLQSRMQRFFSLTSMMDSDLSGDYTIGSIDILSKKTIDFSSFEMSQFINDYSINEKESSQSLTYSLDIDNLSSLETASKGYLIHHI